MTTSDLITVAEAARIIGVERQVAYRYIKAGKLPSERVAGHTLVRREEAERIVPGRQGWTPKENPEARAWTRAMTAKRLGIWNEAVNGGLFEDAVTGKIDPGLIAAWEIEQGWTRDDLLAAVDKYSEEE